jgi:hypothetical protein
MHIDKSKLLQVFLRCITDGAKLFLVPLSSQGTLFFFIIVLY